MSNLIPESHRDLLSHERPVIGVLATLMPDGSPQNTPVWVDGEGENIRINTARGRVKEQNMSARPQVALVLFDPQEPLRHLQIRGQVVGSTEQDAHAHIERLSQKYTGRPFRQLLPGERRVIFEIRPRSVSAQ